MAQLNVGKQQETPTYSLEEELKSQKNATDRIVAGIYGLDNTCKSGIALQLRTKEDIENNRKLFIFDFDQGVAPLKNKFYKNDPNVIILNTSVFYDDGERVGEKNVSETLKKTMTYLRDIRNMPIDSVAGIIFDGLDVYLKLCEFFMKEIDLGLSISMSGKSLGEASKKGEIRRQDWFLRDLKYNILIDNLKASNLPIICITHVKDKLSMVRNEETQINELQVIGEKIDWGDYTRGQMHQRIKCVMLETDKNIIWRATIEKSKGDAFLVGKEIDIMVKDKTNNTIQWFGFPWNLFRE